ncbi:superoxide dismutase [Halenospora varia]|nr:superoxide dismutase [Halenospora varia]
MFASTIIPVILTALVSGVVAQNGTDVLTTGQLGNATVVENNPLGQTYVATLPATSFFNPTDPLGNIKGSVSAVANPNGIGVQFKVSFSNFPTSGGPFIYHLHDAPVPADGNCTNTLAHLDPFIRGEVLPCNSSFPQTCQVGDLSGKHGKISVDPFVASYSDDFAATLPGLGSFFGNRSLTIHFGNKTRITCANFTLQGTSTGGSNSTPTGSPIQYTGAAVKNAAPALSLMGLAALALAL